MARLPGDPYRPDKPTRADVARAAGVSESTVSRALNDHPRISLAARERVKRIAGELGYVPNRAASMLAAERTRRLGLVISSFWAPADPGVTGEKAVFEHWKPWDSPGGSTAPSGPFTRAYFPQLLNGVLLRAEERGYAVEVILDKRDGRNKDLVGLITSREVDGFIFSVTPLDDPRFDLLRDREISFVLVNNLREGMECVNGDPLKGMVRAFELMVRAGYSRIGYVAGDQGYFDGRKRLEIFHEQADRFGLAAQVFAGDFSRTSGYKSGDFFFGGAREQGEGPDCVMTASDRSALGLLHYCREKGISVPGDLGLIGYDDLGPARDSYPALTTIRNPVSEMGSASVDRLVNILEGKARYHKHRPEPPVMHDTELIVRDTTG